MSYYAFAALFNFVTTLALGVIVIIKNPRNKLNLYFSIFSINVALWSFCYFIWQISNSENQALFWSKALMFFAIFIPATYFHFVSTMLDIVKKVRYILWISYGIFAFFLMADIFTSLFVALVKPMPPFLYWPVAGPLFPVFLLIWIGLVIYGNYLLYVAYKNASGVTKLQIKYILLGEIFAFSGGITNYFMWFGIPILPFGNILVSVYVALTAYAIIKHRFLDIRLIFVRSLSYSLLVLVLGFIYAGGLFLIGTYITKQPSNSTNLAVSSLLALLIAFTFQPLLSFFETITSKIFYKNHYDAQDLLKKLGGIMASTIDLTQLSTSLLQELISQMRIQKASLVLKQHSNEMWVKTVGEEQVTKLENEEFSKILQQMVIYRGYKENENLLIFEEMSESGLKDLLRENNISVVVPLMIGQGSIGALLLNDKSSGDIYSEGDINVLKIFGSDAVVAVRNSLSYEEIKCFNITLSEEVEKATKDLKIANTKLTELDRLKDDFVSIASHELRTPMTAIKSYLWMALKRADIPLSEKMQRYLSRAYISTDRLINLVNDMLNVSRIESGSIEINPKEFDIMSLADEAMQMFIPKAGEKNIKTEVLKEKMPNVFGDPDKITQVLLNLLGNALKFTPEGGIINISFFTDGKVVETSVKDSGVGISQDDLSRLFQKFGRLDNSYVAAATSGGTGLGLYISKSLVDLMGGKIWARSEGQGKGTTFTFSLPVVTPEILANAAVFTKKPVGEVKSLEPVKI